LVSSTLSEHGSFIGTFRIHAAKHRESISIGLMQRPAGEFAFHPDTSIEYMDLSGNWQRLLGLPRIFGSVTRVHTLAPGRDFSFNAFLMAQETATLNARGFRLLLRTNSSNCASYPRHCWRPR
jgi:hypothetical protein